MRAFDGGAGAEEQWVARGVHAASPRASAPFVDVNCAAIPETLLESELFGYERGAFTDARRSKPGLFQTAHRGTIFLDWVISASNVDLPAAIRERRFREDLYHRLAVLTLRLPSLRERGQNILLLANHSDRRARCSAP
jgi:transcriptional regulator with PAS, ATPase and Fis domain